MRKIVWHFFIIALVSIGGNQSLAEIRAGLAEVEITPPAGGPMWGYAGRGESVGIHDPLWAQVLYLESGDLSLALICWDVCEFQTPWLRRQTDKAGIDHLLMLNSHSHAGPDLFKDFPSSEKPWLRTIEERLLEAIHKAKSNLFEAYIAAEKGSVPLAYNRLRRDRDGLATTIFNNIDHIPYGPIDPTVGVLRITDVNGVMKAVMVHYACHPVCLGSKNLWISAEYPGVMRRVLKEQLEDKPVVMFVQGGGGDLNPLFISRTGDIETDFKAVEKMGSLMAEEAYNALQWIKTPGQSGSIAAASTVISFQRRWEPEKTMRLGTTSILINEEIGIVTLPGEPFIKFQLDLRERAHLPHTFLFAYCDNAYQDWPNWYLPDIESAARGGYGASEATIPEVGAGERLLNKGLIQLYELRGMLKPEPYPGRRP